MYVGILICLSVTEDLDNRQKEQEIMQSTMGREISELQSLTGEGLLGVKVLCLDCLFVA